MQQRLDFFNCARRIGHVNYRMAVRTDWAQICEWVDFVLLIDGRDGFGVMHMNEACSRRSIDRTEVKPTDTTLIPESLDAASAGNWISFVHVDQYLLHGTFFQGFCASEFILQVCTDLGATRIRQAGNYLRPEFPHEALINCSSTRGDDVPPLEGPDWKALRMASQGLMHFTANATHRAIHLNNGSETEGCSQLPRTCRVVRGCKKCLQNLVIALRERCSHLLDGLREFGRHADTLNGLA